MSFRFLLWCFVLIVLFRFIVRFVVPLLRLTQQSSARIREMQEQMKKSGQAPPQAGAQPKKPRSGEYIEYEEVKD